MKNLPLGSYYIREVKAGDGSFLLNPEVKDVVLVYEGQEVPVVWAEDTHISMNGRRCPSNL